MFVSAGASDGGVSDVDGLQLSVGGDMEEDSSDRIETQGKTSKLFPRSGRRVRPGTA